MCLELHVQKMPPPSKRIAVIPDLDKYWTRPYPRNSNRIFVQVEHQILSLKFDNNKLTSKDVIYPIPNEENDEEEPDHEYILFFKVI